MYPTFHKSATLDGKRIGYTSNTEFVVQVGKGRKGAYKTHLKFVGDLPRAVFHYMRISLGPGDKKRLLMPSSTYSPILARSIGR